MNEMRNNTIPLVILDRYEDFENYAQQAAVVMYRPEFYRGPFLDDPGRIRRVTFTAVGVQVNGVILNFTYTLSHEDMYNPSLGWEDQALEIDRKISEMVTALQSTCGVVRGGLTPSRSLGEALTVRP
ncbi:MAG: hypothetical protein ACW98Y_06725 [Candidatus Thorarchaeota archaeon]|jgi:hypothetical protein